jgi:hypothetical protein
MPNSGKTRWVSFCTFEQFPDFQRHMLTEKKQSAALLAAIKEYDANKWKSIGQKVGKPAKVSLISRIQCRVLAMALQLTIPGL